MALHTSRADGRLVLSATLLASTFLMGSSFISGKILLEQGFPPFLLVGWRFFIAALATLPLVLLDGRAFFAALFPPGLRGRELLIVPLIGLAQTAAVMSLLFLAMRTLSAAAAAILLFTNPLWVALASRVLFAERLGLRRLTGLVLGVVGVALAIGPETLLATAPGLFAGLAYGLASALCWAAATLTNKRNELSLGNWSMSFWQMLIGSLFILLAASLAGEQWPSKVSATQWGWFLWLAIPASTGSFGLWFLALKKGNATRVSGFLFFAPLFAVLLSFSVLGTQLSWVQGLGALAIALAIWLVNG
ncbi:DMT family transporter [Pseudomonas oryzihabitans]|uniref:EamA family transporter n=1 Tax=Pseudomonas oryzihabitans TaxID=47885 RepID=A0ABX3ISK4_9PSED|nr:DMT family transporter [Pseudomonas psychrotolerans]ONN71167.1 EamA family transporter [Pseudomonas psychrotolerans]